MDITVIQYTAREDQREANAALIGRIFTELAFAAPEDLVYEVLQLEDGRFIHIIGTKDGDASALTKLPAFKQFADGAQARFEVQPVRTKAKLIGRHGALRVAPGTPAKVTT